MNELLRSDRRLWLTCWSITLALFAATAHWYSRGHIDAQAADWEAWRIARGHTFDLRGIPHLPANQFFVEAHGRLVAGRTAGVVLAGVPLQWLLTPFQTSPTIAGTLTAVLATATASANVALLLRRLGGERRVALCSALVMALGTAMWTVSSAELWTHGPAALWLSTALLAVDRGRWALASLAFSAAAWTRPHLVLIAAAVALAAAAAERRLRPVAVVGLVTTAALGLLLAWNDWVFGTPSLSGGYYSGYVSARGTDVSTGATVAWLQNVVGGFFSPIQGVFITAPFTLLAVAALVPGWRLAPGWARGALCGGAAYQAVQWHLNDFRGGDGFFGNRLVLELILVSAPVAYLGFLALRQSSAWRTAFRMAAAVSVTEHAAGAALAFLAPVFGGVRFALGMPLHPLGGHARAPREDI